MSRSWLVRHGGAAAITVAGPACVTLLAFTRTNELVPALLYVLAIAAASAAGGVWFGLAASVLAFGPFNFFFAHPRREFGIGQADELVASLLFFLTAIGVGALIEREKRARQTAEEAARRARRLQRAAEALSVAITPAEVLDAILTESVAAAEAQAGLIALLTEDGASLEVVAERGYRSDLLTQWARFPLAADYPLSHAVRTGEGVFVGSERERIERFPELPSGGEPTHALVCLPLHVEGRVIGGVVFSFPEDQEFDDERRALKLALARQAAQALERARLYDALRTAEARVSFLAEAGNVLAASLDYEETLRRLAQIVVPRLADWCTVDLLDEDGAIRRVAIAHEERAKAEWGWELSRRFPPDPDAPNGVPHVLRTGEPEFLPEVPQELLDAAAAAQPGVAEVIEELGLRSWLCVPLKGRDRVLGALSLVGATPGRIFTQADLDLATALAGRAGVAIENALLYWETERRADAARALTYVGDAVVLVDGDGIVRYWNRAATIISGREQGEAIGTRAAEVVPGWQAIAEHVVAADALAGEIATSRTVPVTVADAEHWLSVAAVDFGGGCVYALRDVTDEHRLDQARTDFVTTASHELRTPLAAVYGAARTLRRTDIDLGDDKTDVLLAIIESESERLNAIVAQILVAGQIDSDTLSLRESRCDVAALVEDVLAAARLRAPESLTLELRAPTTLPVGHCDEEKLRQVLVNLVENAIKYSPQGESVVVELDTTEEDVEIAVTDQGLGIPAADQGRVFDKFVRLDPGLSRGVGGTGLGLYIARELVERMGGSIAVDSSPGKGSTFTVTIPLGVPAAEPVATRRDRR
jgi:PAS domain S-box-containing protein